MIYPCKECKTRFPGCHDRCDAYLVIKSNNEANQRKRHQENEVTNLIIANENAGRYKPKT